MTNRTIYDLRDELAAGQISRRQFLKRAGALGISAAATSSLLVSAASSAASSSAPALRLKESWRNRDACSANKGSRG